MKYRVRSKDGELEFPSFKEVEQFWLMGLIEPEDEVLEEGKTLWRKAGTIPLLAAARRSGDKVWMGSWFIWTLLGVAGGTIALVLLNEGSMKQQIAGGIVAIATAALMVQVTVKQAKRAKPHHDR